MKSKLLPYIFLAILLLIATLVIGVQIGKKVEEKNKVTSYTLSLTPSVKPISPIPTKPLSFETYLHEGCGIGFVVPGQLSTTQESTEEAALVDNNITSVTINCKKNAELQTLNNEPVATSEVKITNQEVVGTIQNTKYGNKTVGFTVRNPINGKNITIKITPDLLSLFERTVEFSR